MKNRKGNLLMTLGLVLILAALALVGYNQWDASRAQQESVIGASVAGVSVGIIVAVTTGGAAVCCDSICR